MLDGYLLTRTVVNLVSLIIFFFLVLKTRKVQYLILEVQIFILLVLRFMLLVEYSIIYYDILLTATTFTTLILAVYCLVDYYKELRELQRNRRNLIEASRS